MDQGRVKELFDYRDGKLFWKTNKGSQGLAGAEAGALRDDGYRLIGVDGRLYRAHKLIWLWHRNELPELLDHIDNDPTNNRIENLRIATRSENGFNSGARTNTKSGIKGVWWHQKNEKWRVSIYVNGRPTDFGCYEDLELAELVAIEARNKYHGAFARHA